MISKIIKLSINSIMDLIALFEFYRKECKVMHRKKRKDKIIP